MFTAIIHREEYESWDCGERTSTSPSRMEIVFDKEISGLRDKILEVARSFSREVIQAEADHPEYKFLYNGIPQDYLEEAGIENHEQMYDALWSLEQAITRETHLYEKEFRKELAVKANEERLERERKEKAAEKERDLRQLRLLNAKYGKDV